MRTLCFVALVACGGKTVAPPVEPPPPETPTGNVDIADHAMPLVDAWAEVLGGRDAIAKLGTVHTKGDCVIEGQPCTFESFVSPKGELRFTVVYPDRMVVRGFDGTSAWRQEGGAVIDVTGSELEAVLRHAFFESHSMFFSDRLHGSIARDGATSLAITPRGVTGSLVVRFRSDGFPISREAPGVRMVYTAWNEYLGVQIPQAWTAGPSGTENTFRLSHVDDEQGDYGKP